MLFFKSLVVIFHSWMSDLLCAAVSDGALASTTLALLLGYLAPLAIAALNQLAARWGEALAVRWAAWLDAHQMPQMAARVLAVNGLA